MGAVQRLATVVIVGLVALATILVLYLADENNRIDAEETSLRDDSIERATANFVSLCLQCHGPGGQGLQGPDAKDSAGKPTGRIGLPIGGDTYAKELNQHGSTNGTPWAGASEDGVTYTGGFDGRTDWIRHRITYGKLKSDGTYAMPAFWEGRGGPLNTAQVDELVTMVQYGDWNKIYNEAIATYGGYPTPGANPALAAAAAAPTAAATQPAAAGPTINLAMKDIAFDQTELAIPSNTAVTVHLTNEGASVHNFNIDSLNIHSGDVQPGASVDLTVNAADGTYDYYCNIPGHKEAGMVGKLTASADAPGPGGDAPAAPPAAGSGTPAAIGGGALPATFDIKLQDIMFDKTELNVPAGVEITLNVTNEGAAPHNFNIDSLNVHSGDVDPGKSVQVKFTAPAGNYDYYCNIPGHKEAGMVGKLIAAEGGGAAAAEPPANAAGAPTAAALAGVPPVAVSLEDIAFNPTEITITANEPVTINLTNMGAAAHNFNVDSLNVHSGDLQAGEMAAVTITAAPGTYDYYCSVPGHKEAGMVGKLIVK